MSFRPYKEEIFPDNIKYIIDNEVNRLKMVEIYGKVNFSDHIKTEDGGGFLELDIDKKTCHVTFSFTWMYRNTPPLIDIDSIYIPEIRKKKIDGIINDLDNV